MKTIICLMGPTASGKTQLAVELIKKFPFDIISVDSALVYKGMDIGTAKPSEEILKIAPHRLIDFRDPAEPYSAALFKQDALREIKDIFSHNKTPLLVGGTMLYFRALQEGLSDMPAADLSVRKQLQEDIDNKGLTFLHERLKQIDPIASQRIHPHDSQRIQRALEVFLISGKTLTEYQNISAENFSDFKWINLAMAPQNRSILHERIAKRFSDMLDMGLVDEVKKLFARKDLNLNTPAIRSVGYRQVWEYLQGTLTFDEMRERGIIATRQLAKRQLTWLRSAQKILWFDSEDVVSKDKIGCLFDNIRLFDKCS